MLIEKRVLSILLGIDSVQPVSWAPFPMEQGFWESPTNSLLISGAKSLRTTKALALSLVVQLQAVNPFI